MPKLHYEDSGDNYKIKDPFKILALQAAKKTAKNLKRFSQYGINLDELPQSRGESAYRIQINTKKPLDFQLAHVEEGIGTKNIIADELEEIFGETFYESTAIDNAASIFNDLSTTGAAPLSFLLHIAAYPTEWFSNTKKITALINGTVKACNQAGASWGGGESPTMRDIIQKNVALLSGSATGLIIPAKKALSEEKLQPNDRIILLQSSGVHTNGITLLRKELLKKLPQGYKTKLSDGQTYGKALITPSFIYSGLIEELVQKTQIHYAVHITGHGWRKIMRANKNFTYIIDNIPTPQPVFDLIKTYSNSSDYNMYDSYNMGAGFALFAPENSLPKIFKITKKWKIKALDAGFIKTGPKKIIINPLSLEFKSKSLSIR